MPSVERPNSFTNPLIGEKPKAKKTSCCTHFSRCCIILFVLIILIVIGCVAAFFLWARKPEIKYEGLEKPDPNAFKMNGLDFSFDLKLKFLVDNPNYVGAVFDQITAKARLPIDGEPTLGYGQLKELTIDSQSKTNLLFPIQITYNFTEDKGLKTLKHIAEKCGLLENKKKSKLNIKYTVSSAVKILFTVIDLMDIHSNIDIDCPIPPNSQIPGLNTLLNLLSSPDLKDFDPKNFLNLLKTNNLDLNNVRPEQIKDIVGQLDPKHLNQLGQILNNPAAANILKKFST